MKTTDRPTPQTDAHYGRIEHWPSDAEFARRLEQQRDALRDALKLLDLCSSLVALEDNSEQNLEAVNLRLALKNARAILAETEKP